MTSTTLKPKSNLSVAFKRVFKQNIVNSIISLFASIAVAVIGIGIIFERYLSNLNGVKPFSEEMTLAGIIVLCVITAITGVFALTLAPKMYKEIYKKQSCDFYFSTPIKREEYYIANYIFGAVVIIIDFLVSTLLFCVVLNIASNKIVTFTFNYAVIAFMLVVLLLDVISIYSAFIVCAVISGKRGHYAILSLICLLCPSAITTGFVTRINTIWGMSFSGYVASLLSPVTSAVNTVMNGDIFFPPIIISLVEISAFFVIGYIAFKRRKAEVAEVTLYGKIVPFVFLAIVSCAAYMYAGSNNGFVATFGGIAFAVVISMGYTAIFYKKAFTKNSLITTLSVCAVCSIIMIFVYSPIHNSYVKYLPEASEVKSVEVSDSYSSENLSELLGLFESNLIDDLSEKVLIESEDGISNVIALHAKSINDNVIEESKSKTMLSFFDLFSDDFIDSFGNQFTFRLVYNMKNGTKVERVYSVNADLVTKEYCALIKNKEVLSQLEPFNIDPSKIVAVDGYLFESIAYDEEDKEDYEQFYEGDFDNPNVILDNFDYDKFCKCFMNDLMKLNTKEFMYMSSYLGWSYYGYEDDDIIDINQDLNIYVIADDAKESDIEKIKSMSPKQISDYYTNYYWEIDAEESLPIDRVTVSVYYPHKETINYLNECGLVVNN